MNPRTTHRSRRQNASRAAHVGRCQLRGAHSGETWAVYANLPESPAGCSKRKDARPGREAGAFKDEYRRESSSGLGLPTTARRDLPPPSPPTLPPRHAKPLPASAPERADRPDPHP